MSVLPRWLEEASPEGPLPIMEILSDCTYYPASGLDGLIFSRAWQSARTNSFVHVDYGVSHDALAGALMNEIDNGGQGLRGYRPEFRRGVKQHELAVPGWLPQVTLSAEESKRAQEIYRTLAAGQNAPNLAAGAYCEWVVFKREEGYDDCHGPARLSLLFLFADGIMAYDALFLSRGIAPKTLAIKQPGHAFGFNHTNFFVPGGPLHRAVHAQRALPSHLIFGGMDSSDFYRESLWPGYNFDKEEHLPGQRLVFASRSRPN